jgi:hypothetical protein
MAAHQISFSQLSKRRKRRRMNWSSKKAMTCCGEVFNWPGAHRSQGGQSSWVFAKPCTIICCRKLPLMV